MKANTIPHNNASLGLDPSTGAKVDHVLAHTKRRAAQPQQTAEEELTNRIFREGNGSGLIKFCRELAVILIRQYRKDENVAELRTKLVSSLTTTLKCSELQATCLMELALELIHARIHGKYRRTNVELSYLIATATGAVDDVSSN